MVASIIDGKALAARVQDDLRGRIAALKEKNIQPRLDVILIGDNPASLIYVEMKQKTAKALGIECLIHTLPQDIAEADVIKKIIELNVPQTHGILIQLPVPAHLNVDRLINTIDPKRDVDGLTIVNIGERIQGYSTLLPCTPKGVMKLIKSVRKDLTGLHAVVIGRSNLVGKPIGQLLLQDDCSITQIHSKSENAVSLIKQADILVVAIGRPHHIKAEWIKPGAIVIDVGITRVDGVIKGDVDFENAKNVAGHITPVPGGVGPMTVACLMENVVEAAEKSV